MDDLTCLWRLSRVLGALGARFKNQVRLLRRCAAEPGAALGGLGGRAQRAELEPRIVDRHRQHDLQSLSDASRQKMQGQ